MKQFFYTFIFLTSCFININFTYALESFTDFPDIDVLYDISASRSDLGDNYIKIKAFINDKIDNYLYLALYKEYDRNLNLIDFKQMRHQGIPEFHILVQTTNYYDACIVLIDKSGNLVARSPIERIVPSRFLTKNKKEISEYTTQNFRKRSARSTGLEVDLEINSYKFPIIDLTTEVKQNGVYFDSNNALSVSNFNIVEDGRPQVIREFVPPEESTYTKIADIVFVHDDSGSLSDEAAQVAANINIFVNELNKSAIDYRIGLVPFGGNGGFSQPGGTILHDGILHSQGSSLISDIGNMRFDGGTEQSFCAIKKAIQNIKWRPSAQKVIILITDEDNDCCGVYQNDLINLLKANNIIVYTLYLYGWGNADNDFQALAEQTNGKTYPITDDFTSIITDIGADIAAKYLIQYRTDNTELELSRNVELKVTHNNETATILENYIPSPLIIVRTPETVALSNSGQRSKAKLTIVAKIKQKNSSINASLYFKNSSVSYQSIQMTSIGDDLYSVTIPENYVINPCIYYYFSVSNGAITTTLPSTDPSMKPFKIPVLPNMPPFINHERIKLSYENQDIDISAEVEDVTDSISIVSLYYRKLGESVYKVVSVNPGTVNYLFNTIIPASEATTKGIEYYIYAEDNFGVSTYEGIPDNPIQITVDGEIIVGGFKNIGNIRVYASYITEDSQNQNLWIASGNVLIGTVDGQKKLLQTKTSLKLHLDTKTI